MVPQKGKQRISIGSSNSAPKCRPDRQQPDCGRSTKEDSKTRRPRLDLRATQDAHRPQREHALLDMPLELGGKAPASLRLPPSKLITTSLRPSRKTVGKGAWETVCREGQRINLRKEASDSKLFHPLNRTGFLPQVTVWLLPSFSEVSIQKSHKDDLSPLCAKE